MRTRTPTQPRRNDERGDGGTDTRVLPHDSDAEIALLGSICLNADCMSDVREVLTNGAAEFWHEHHRIFYRVVDRIVGEGRPIDDVVIRDELVRAGEFDRIGGYDFMVTCVNSVASWHRARHYATVVHEHYLRRRTIEAASHAVERAYKLAPVEELVEDSAAHTAKMSELALSREREDGSLVELVAASLDELRNPTERKAAISTGFYGLDSLIYGLEPGELVLIGARPSRGKTALGLCIAEHIACNDGLPVLLFSIEMRPSQVAMRMILSRARVSGHDAKNNRLEAGHWAMLEQAADQIAAAPLFVHNRIRRIDDIVNMVRIAVRDHGVRVVMIDYLGLIDVRQNFATETLRIAHITRTIKTQIAEDNAVPVVLLAQLNRKADSEGGAPRMDHFRDSGAIEQDADKIILPWQNPEKVETQSGTRRMVPGPVELIVDKHRNGPTGVVELDWQPQFARFANPNIRDDQSEFSYRH